MILVYCEDITPRHRYIFDFIFRDVLGSSCQLTGDPEEFLSSGQPKISYGRDDIRGPVHFASHGLLSEKGLKEQGIRMSDWKGLPVFFQVDGPSAVPFDPFAMAFYLVSRYEEYLPFTADEHGRFRAELSLAYREGFLQIPLVNAVFHEVKMLLEDIFPGIDLPGAPFRFVPSFDIDIAFAHLGKGWIRAAAAWARLFLKRDFGQIRERMDVTRGKIKDPYDNFGLHRELAEKYGHEPLYFVLLGDFSRHDRNVGHHNRRFRKLLEELGRFAGMGVHPSYRSFLRPELLRKEMKRLEQATGKPVQNSRFHFLRLRFPDSFRHLEEAGILNDYSLGYSDVNGFRAGTCTPFCFYDLIREEVSPLKLHPFLFMDSAMIDHMRLDPGKAYAEIRNLSDQVSKYGGEAVGIWHNYSLSEKEQYRGWQEVLVKTLAYYQNPAT